MKKIRFLFLLIILFISPVFADNYLNMGEFLQTYFNTIIQDNQIPTSYKYIQLKYPNISRGSSLYKALQKAIYLNVFPNTTLSLPLDQKITQKQAMTIIRQGFDFVQEGNADAYVTVDWMKKVILDLQYKAQLQESYSFDTNPFITSSIVEDVYTRLQNDFYMSGTIDDKVLLYGGIKGMVDSLKDPYTIYITPFEAQQYNDELEGEYYGIGAYVEMKIPGKMIITAPIKDSPADKAGLLAGDQILQIGDNVITEDVTLELATNWIKGPEGTIVVLKVLRNGKTLTISVKRAKITLDAIKTIIYSGDTGNICYVSLSIFSLGIAQDFDKVMQLLSQKSCLSYIFDVRDNPGGSLDEVVKMLNYFVPTGKTSVVIKSKTTEETIVASEPQYNKILKKKIRVLINNGSASASEIFAGVIKEYIPSALLIGERSYGKGSVQELVNYSDGTMLKYTVAKRYTGKNDKNIDKIGIQPDVEMKDLTGTLQDEILNYALFH